MNEPSIGVVRFGVLACLFVVLGGVACSTNTSDTTEGDMGGDHTEADLMVWGEDLADTTPPPSIDSVSLVPATVTVANTIMCEYEGFTSRGGEDLSTYAWQLNGDVVEGATSSTFPGGHVRGDEVTCIVTPNDGEQIGSPVTKSIAVGNASPTPPTSVQITPAYAVNGEPLVCFAEGATDEDGDDISYSYRWFERGVSIDGEDSSELPAFRLRVGDEIYCSVSATDGRDASDVVRSDVRLIEMAFEPRHAFYVKPEVSENIRRFGSMVDLEGDRALVGSAMSDVVYIYERLPGNSWTRAARLKNQDIGGGSFGGAFAISGNIAVLGAPGDERCSTDPDGERCLRSGAVYIFERRPGGDWVQTAYFKHNQVNRDDLFGGAVDISGERIVVGAPGESSCSPADESNNECGGAGAVYIFERQGGDSWQQAAYLKVEDPRIREGMGGTVGISGDYVIAGSFAESRCPAESEETSCPSSGAAYIFERQADGSWQQAAYLKASNAERGDFFGGSVSISAERAVVGAEGESSCLASDESDNNCEAAGAAYVFERRQDDGWPQVAYLKSTNITEFDNLGRSVSISDDRVVVGSSREDLCADLSVDTTACGAAGGAYVFEHRPDGSWPMVKRLAAFNTQAIDLFGHSVSISGNELLISAPREDGCLAEEPDGEGCADSGAAYFFE